MEITFDSKTLILSVLEKKPLYDADGNMVDYTNHRTTLTPADDELATQLGSDIERAFAFFMRSEVKAEYQQRINATEQ